ncbi:MAG TPA: ABC transporter ATP-binding protein [Acidimicrobiia bacterium]|nr:ABC transporter ATP-binding protein [Acidimicrobiia bacterium]
MNRGSERDVDDDRALRREGRRLLRDSLRAQMFWVAMAVVAALTWTVAKLAVPILVAGAVDNGIVPNDSSEIVKYTLLIVVAGVFQGAGMGLRRYTAFRMSYRVETDLRARLFAHLQLLHFAFHDEAQTGQLMARANTDLYQITQWMTLGPISLSSVFILFGVMVVMLVASPVLALLALGALPLLNLVAARFSRRLAPVGLEQQEKLGDLSGVVAETVGGIRAVKGFGAEALQEHRLESEAEEVRAWSLKAARLRANFLPALDFLPALSLAAIIWYGGHQVLDGNLAVGDIIAFNLYIVMLIFPLRLAGQLVAQAARATAAAGRVSEVLRTDPEITSPPHGRPLTPEGRGELRFEDVRFRYGDGPLVLDGFDLTLHPGEAVALVGPTASGKTTVARLIPRFYDVEEGRVLLDGVDVRELQLDDVRRAVGIVFEDTFLFSDTVRNNIAFADPDAPVEQIRRAARLAGADFIDALPDGYDTVIGEFGYSLSGGQRQRIAIARAVLADPRVLILDDATSSVDPTKEHEIRAALREVMAGRTTIIIAHRPATIALADRVVLLDGGRVVDQGAHDELLTSSERYRHVLAQAAGVAPPDGEEPVGDGAAVEPAAGRGT